MINDRPIFAVVTAAGYDPEEEDEEVLSAAMVAARRLCTVAAVQTIMASPPTDAEIEAAIDAASAIMAQVAFLAEDGVNVPTFGQEECRATWYGTTGVRTPELVMPWRTAMSVTSVTEAGVELDDDDYVLRPGGLLIRLGGDGLADWSTGKIVVEFAAGWSLPSGAPGDLAALCAQQVKYQLMSKPINPALRSVTVDELRTESYNVPGGDSVAKSGLLAQVEADLIRAYRATI